MKVCEDECVIVCCSFTKHCWMDFNETLIARASICIRTSIGKMKNLTNHNDNGWIRSPITTHLIKYYKLDLLIVDIF